MKILSIDPALNSVGYAVVEKSFDGSVKILSSGIIKNLPVKKPDLLDNSSECVDVVKIKNIILNIKNIYEQNEISKVVIEETFVNINMKSSLSLALARGALIGFFSLFQDVKIFQITPTEVKKIITGNGNADKEQVLKMFLMKNRI
jgi:crossover junction endodeoxyribonuclease RuvC